MKKSYLSPTIFNVSNMKLSTTSRGNNLPVLEVPEEGAIMPVILSLDTRIMLNFKGIGEKMNGLPNRKI
ncbi:MAG: hypothetical protein IKI76_00270 [Selenomonadaceae bacterium]|nr:hypothetical protein [Selenomonadaceae bacterium]